jgi:hypothetical protein
MSTIDMTGAAAQGVSQALEVLISPEYILDAKPDPWEDSTSVKPLCLSKLGLIFKSLNKTIRRRVHEAELAFTPEQHLECMYDRVFKKTHQFVQAFLAIDMGAALTTELTFFYEHSTHVSLSLRDFDVSPPGTTTHAESRFELSLRWTEHGCGVVPDKFSIMKVPYDYIDGNLSLLNCKVREIVKSHTDALFSPLLNEHLVRTVLAKHRDVRTHELKVFDDARVAANLAAIARMARQGPRLDSLERAAKRTKK